MEDNNGQTEGKNSYMYFIIINSSNSSGSDGSNWNPLLLGVGFHYQCRISDFLCQRHCAGAARYTVIHTTSQVTGISNVIRIVLIHLEWRRQPALHVGCIVVGIMKSFAAASSAIEAIVVIVAASTRSQSVIEYHREKERIKCIYSSLLRLIIKRKRSDLMFVWRSMSHSISTAYLLLCKISQRRQAASAMVSIWFCGRSSIWIGIKLHHRWCSNHLLSLETTIEIATYPDEIERRNMWKVSIYEISMERPARFAFTPKRFYWNE